MDAYVELTLSPDDEFPQHVLMDALIAKLHRALVERGSNAIGVSFPQWRDGSYPTLGCVTRLHGGLEDLENLMARDWLRGMRDHARIDGPRSLPLGTGYLLVERRKPKSAENMRKRAMRRHGLSKEEAQRRIPDSAGDHLDLPYATQRSASTGQRYRLFIRQRQVCNAGVGGFNTHGLSLGTAVPAF